MLTLSLISSGPVFELSNEGSPEVNAIWTSVLVGSEGGKWSEQVRLVDLITQHLESSTKLTR